MKKLMLGNEAIARGLYEAVDIGQEIPREFYTAVAEVLAMVYEEQHKTLPPRERQENSGAVLMNDE